MKLKGKRANIIAFLWFVASMYKVWKKRANKKDDQRVINVEDIKVGTEIPVEVKDDTVIWIKREK